jgi:predicted aldo/keto reductase-like oxidoreductase
LTFSIYSPSQEVIKAGDYGDIVSRLKRSGVILGFGVACNTFEDALVCVEMKAAGIDAIQVELNQLNQDRRRELLSAARRNRIAVVARAPLGGGKLLPKGKRVSRSALDALLRPLLDCHEISTILTATTSCDHLTQNINTTRRWLEGDLIASGA